MPNNTKFIPHIPNPFDPFHKFEKDEIMDKIIEIILGDQQDKDSVLYNWNQYFKNHLIPFRAMVESPVKEKKGNQTTTKSCSMTVLEIAPPEKCPLPYLLFTAQFEKEDGGRYIFAQDIRKLIDNQEAEHIFYPYLYWFYFQKSK